MKILEPVERDKVPPTPNARTDFDELFQRALSSNGLAVPVEFETVREASNLRALLSQSASRGGKLGLKAIQRGNTVFVYKSRS